MKRLFKKKLFISFAISLLLMGSSQAYAATVLNTNILNLIKEGYSSITAYFMQTTEQEVIKIESDNSNDIKQYIDTTSKQTIRDIETYMNSEVTRADKEIDTYTNELKKQLDTIVNEEESKTKQQITQKINSNVESIKSDLNKDMEKYIKELIKK